MMQASNQWQQMQQTVQAVNHAGNSNRSNDKKGGLFGMMTTILTLYFSAALLGELTEALEATGWFGPTYTGLVALVVYMYYNIKKSGANNRGSNREYVTDYRAKYRELNPGKMELSASNIPVWMVVVVIGGIVLANEAVGIGVLTDWSENFWSGVTE